MRRPLDMQEIRRRALRAAGAAAGASLVACSSAAGPPVTGQPQASDTAADGSVAGDAAATEVVAADGAQADSEPADAATADGGPVDTPVADAATADAATADTAAADAPVADTAAADTAAADAGSADTEDATKADAGATCPELEPGQPDCLALRGKPVRGGCCQELGKWCSAEHPSDQEASNLCLFGPNFSGQCTGCIPWGPPAPPHFDEAWRPSIQPMGAVFEVA